MGSMLKDVEGIIDTLRNAQNVGIRNLAKPSDLFENGKGSRENPDDTPPKVFKCPFNHQVGGAALIGFEDGVTVTCTVCGAMGPISGSEEEAIAKWNDRWVLRVFQDPAGDDGGNDV